MQEFSHAAEAYGVVNDNNEMTPAKKPAATPPVPNTPTVSQHPALNREIFLHGPITRDSAHAVILKMRVLAQQSKEPITLRINSNGGSVYDGLAIFDTMRELMNEGITIKTVAYGMAASMGSFLLSAGSPGHRTMLPSSKEMTHQPSRGSQGGNQEYYAEVANSLQETRELVEAHYLHFMGLDPEDENAQVLLKEYMSPDVYLNAYMAHRLGLVDNIAMQEDGKPSADIKDEFLRKSIEIDIRQQKKEFDEIDTSRGSSHSRRFVKQLVEYRDKYLAQQSAAAAPSTAQQNPTPTDP